ncbi:MAG TPA: hypothetical protein VLD57_07320, partial [Blastocatellia bacterium]|nr:hypothetical protein [Blastocatellia bacterium]
MRTADAIDYYHELLAAEHLSSTQELLARATERDRLAFGDRPVCTVLRPCFIDEASYDYIKSVSILVMRGIARLGEALVSDAKLRGELDLTSEEEEIALIDSGYGSPDVSARLDGFLSPEGEFNFVEYNAESPGGLAYGDALAQAFIDMPVMKAFSDRYIARALPIRDIVFDSLMGTYKRWGGKGIPNIAIIDWRGVSTYSEFLLMQSHFETRGCRVRIADPSELEYRGGRLFVEDFAIDLVYKRVVINEFMAKYGVNHPLVEAVRDRAVCMANGFGVQMLYKKGIFALASDPAYAHLFEP